MEFNVKNPIPVECYDEIFYQLRNDRKTLHSCIFVNRFFCHLAVPLLWGTPFEHVDLDNPKAPLIISTYVNSFVDEDKSYLKHSGIQIKPLDAPFFSYPEFLTSFNSQVFQTLIDKWLRLVDQSNYSVNYQSKFKYLSYLVSNLLFETAKLESLRYFRFNSNDEMIFIKHKEFDYSISKLVNLEIDYYNVGNNSDIQSEENKLNDLFNALTCYTFSVRFVKIKIISHHDNSFTTRVIKSIADFIAHQFNLEALSFNESLISENLFQFEEIINSQAKNLKYLKVGGTLKSFARILKVLRNCVNLKLLEFGGEEETVLDDDYMQDVEVWNYCNYDLEEVYCGKVDDASDVSMIEEFEFNQLKIENIYCIENCAIVENESGGYTYDEQEQQQQQQQLEITNGTVSFSDVGNDVVSLGLEKILIMTTVNLRTLNLGKINSTIISTLGKCCFRLTHLSCELPMEDFLLFIKLLEVLKELEHLKLMLKLSSIINDNYIIAFANSISNSLQKFGLNLYNADGENGEYMNYFLRVLLGNLYCNNLSELEFYNDQMIRDDNLQLILQFALNRIGVGGYGGGGGDGKFKSFKYVKEDLNMEDFDRDLLRNGRNIINIECEELSDFHHPFYEPFCYEKD